MLGRLASVSGPKGVFKANLRSYTAPISSSKSAKRIFKTGFQIRLTPAFITYQSSIHGSHWNVSSVATRFGGVRSRFYASEAEESSKVTLEQELRSHLKGFLLRVHPDFFSKHPKVQEENDRSLKQLNSLLDIVEDYSQKPAGPIQLDVNRVPKTFRATFYLRPGPKSLVEAKREEKRKEEGGGTPKNRDPLAPLMGTEFEAIGASYNFPETYFTDPFPREMLERDVRLFLNDLLKQAGLPVMEVKDSLHSARFDENSDAIADQFDESGSFRPKKEFDSRRQQQALRKAFKEAIQGFLDRHYPAAQMAVDKLGEDWEMHIGHKEEASVALGISELHHSTDRERKQVHYSPDLNGEERAQGLLLIEELWHSGTIPSDLPIYILKQHNMFLSPSALPGFLTIPLSFDMPVLDQYLKDNLKNILISRYNTRGQLMETEQFIRQFTKGFKLARIDVRASLEHTFSLLSSINEIRSQLEEKFKDTFEGMTWHIVEADSLAQVMAENPNAFYVDPKTPTPTSPLKKNTKTSKVTSSHNENSEAVTEEEKPDYEFEEVDGLPMRRRKIHLSNDHLERMKEIRAHRAELLKKKGSVDVWDDEEDDAILDPKLTSFESSAHKSENDTMNVETDEFEDAMHQAQKEQSEKVNSEVLNTESIPLYSLARDTLLIPWNTSSQTLWDWLHANHAVWHFRQKIYPTKLWRRKLTYVTQNLKHLLGVERVTFSDRAIWDKSLQLLAMKNLQKFAPMIKNAELNKMRVVVTHRTLSLNMRKQTLKVPYNINPAMWTRFIHQLNAERQLRQKLSRSRL